MNYLQLLILILATWRISNLLTDEVGPYRILEKIRTMDWGAFDCIRCMSIWIAAIVAIGYFIFPLITFWILLPFALSAGAILFDRYGG